jgi:hypothetical protein
MQMYLWMDVLVDVRGYGWMDGMELNGWMEMYVCMDGWMDGWKCRLMDGWIDGWNARNGWMEMYVCMYGWMDGSVD